MKKGEEQARSLFGISLTDRPKWQQFLICSSGFFFGYLVNGICEECVQSLEIQIRMVLHIRARVCVRGGWSWPAGIGDSEGAPERAAGRGSPLRGNCHVGWPDEVPEVLEKEDEHQVLPRPHPLPCPFQDPLEDHQRVGKHLRALTKHPHKKIQVAASDLINFWKNVVIEETGDKKNGNSQSSSKFEVKSERVEAVKVEKVTEAGPIRVNTVSKLENIKVERLSSENGIKTEGIAKKTERVKIKKSEADCPPKLSSVVKCNDPVRDKLRELLAEAFSRVYKETSESERDEVKNILDEVDACDPHRVAVIVESAMYKKLGSSTGSHKLKYRSVMFNLKDSKNPDFRRRVLLGHVKAEKLVDLTPEDMASDERKVAKKQIKDKALFECERAGAPKATTDQFKCGRCGQRKCTYHQMQTRSADEPMTTFVTCVNCNNHWKFC